MALLYRSMRVAGDDLPHIGPFARSLGVRVPEDIPVGDDGIVEPGTGGMSVIDTPEALPPWRRPPEYGGSAPDPLWEIAEEDLPHYLTCRREERNLSHGLVEPIFTMTLEDFQDGLAETRELWRRC